VTIAQTAKNRLDAVHRLRDVNSDLVDENEKLCVYVKVMETALEAAAEVMTDEQVVAAAERQAELLGSNEVGTTTGR
jgi:hypothetical protein